MTWEALRTHPGEIGADKPQSMSALPPHHFQQPGKSLSALFNSARGRMIQMYEFPMTHHCRFVELGQLMMPHLQKIKSFLSHL